jgi:diadenosine tetraphosphate (Ap4A) HIT family hydrolase
MDCPFCQIQQDKTTILNNGNHVRVILSNPRLMKGHLLITPKRHVEKLSELNQEEITELINKTIEFQEKILNTFAKGCDIRQNYRPFQKQNNLKVNHLHIHLQPRELEDELYKKCQITEGKIFTVLTEDEKREIFALFS